MTYSAKFERPVEAKLIVRLDNGEEWEATKADLEKFGLDRTTEAYYRFDSGLEKLLTEAGLIDGDITYSRLNQIRYFAELAICHPDLLDHRDSDWSRIIEIERILQEHLPSDR